ncbi:hypothetical protein [Longimicrobium sp.]|uniref:hypothetical protein n=1 Tax=Longimicrobium sp. TaxID=2029185 RepID=UPI002E334893|nr:hypothetical protein [Longimicrobium sp.]HEX6040299.1 hypothetical protein [Longimicrobium sp.]
MMRLNRARAAALMLVAALAACADAPTAAPAIAADQPPSLDVYPAPVVSVTNSGGHPLISWSALTGATRYDVAQLVTGMMDNFQTMEHRQWTDTIPLYSGTSTSYLDAYSTWTSALMCTATVGDERYRWYYHYLVTATFANGTSSTQVLGRAQC